MQLSNKSLDNLKGVHPDLVSVVKQAIEMGVIDFSVNEGIRSYERQKELVASGASKTILSKHRVQDDGFGHAVDLYPYPIDMKKVNAGDAREISRFGLLAGVILAIAHQSGISLRWGGDWDKDGQTLDSSFFDAPHFEIDD